MTDSLISKANSQIQQLLGQSRYRVDVHGCTEFLDVVTLKSCGGRWRSMTGLTMK